MGELKGLGVLNTLPRERFFKETTQLWVLSVCSFDLIYAED